MREVLVVEEEPDLDAGPDRGGAQEARVVRTRGIVEEVPDEVEAAKG